MKLSPGDVSENDNLQIYISILMGGYTHKDEPTQSCTPTYRARNYTRWSRRFWPAHRMPLTGPEGMNSRHRKSFQEKRQMLWINFKLTLHLRQKHHNICQVTFRNESTANCGHQNKVLISDVFSLEFAKWCQKSRFN